MDNLMNETTEQYNARIKAELDEAAEAERQLSELKSFETQCIAALAEHTEVKSGMISIL